MAESIISYREAGYRLTTDSNKAIAFLAGVTGAIRHCGKRVAESGNFRTICAPSDDLKKIQRAILERLERIPVHRDAHGFVRRRNPLSCAMAHTSYWGSDASSLVILNMDAKDFFHSLTSTFLRKSLQAHGLKEKEITGIISHCTLKADIPMAVEVLDGISRCFGNNSDEVKRLIKNVSDILVLGDEESGMPDGSAARIAFAICQNFLSLGTGVTMVNRFLPQGAPTSPCLSNLMLKIVDIRLSAMARTFGGFYTRYADDFTVSWKAPTSGKVIDSMYRCTNLVLSEYKVILNRKKKRVMGRGRRQDIVGYCVNSGRPTISRESRRRIRAAVHNEIVRGSVRLRSGKRSQQPSEDYSTSTPSQSRMSFLMGHIAHIHTAHPKEAGKYAKSLEFSMLGRFINRTEIYFNDDEIQLDLEAGSGNIFTEREIEVGQ